ncbi:MAG: PEGA domain-containing protein [Porticoccaceae bacterium]|nr:PEGA domain-containing protein [Porticoccaceae bacterium]
MPDNNPLLATDFTPLDGNDAKRGLPLSPGMLTLAVLAGVGIIIMAYLFMARAVIFQTEPNTAEIEISGLSFNIGDNYLLLRGDYDITANATGYYPLLESISVGDDATQELKLELQPLPGNLSVTSELENIKVSVDSQSAGTVPGTIEGISRGSHQLEFNKYRYFSLLQEIDIDGLGKTQSLNVSLLPAWGQMQFTTIPAGAELYIDERLIGQTPVTAEVLETGSQLKVTLAGYKTYTQQVSVKAGTSAQQPPIALIVADGTLQIDSSPSSASVTINNKFLGTTPLEVALAPFTQHRVELFLEGYLKASQLTQVQPEKTSKLAINLVPNIGSIAFTVSPADAQILVNNRNQGSGSRTLSLTAKPHSVSIQKEGYETKSLTVTPRPGHEQALKINLLTLQQAYWASRPPAVKSSVGSPLKLFRPDNSFTLGAPRRQPGRRANEAERSVSLQRPFYLGTKEISNAELRRWKANHSSSALRGQSLDMDQQPAVKVSWEDAALFCNWLSKREGLPQFYLLEAGVISGFNWDAHGYRLPTEAEWAWAARIDANGNSKIFPWANDLYPPMDVTDNYADQSASRFLTFTIANYNDKTPVSAQTGSFKANHKGLYNMSGNVAEWVNDYYDVRPSRGDAVLDPTGPATGTRHVIRGASWALGSRTELRLSYREAGVDGRLDVGFRIARYVDSAGAKP